MCADGISKHQKLTFVQRDQFCSNHFRSCICRSNLNSYQLQIESHKSANTVRNIRLRGPAAMDYDLEFFVFCGITELGTPDPRPQTPDPRPQTRNPEPGTLFHLFPTEGGRLPFWKIWQKLLFQFEVIYQQVTEVSSILYNTGFVKKESRTLFWHEAQPTIRRGSR